MSRGAPGGRHGTQVAAALVVHPDVLAVGSAQSVRALTPGTVSRVLVPAVLTGAGQRPALASVCKGARSRGQEGSGRVRQGQSGSGRVTG